MDVMEFRQTLGLRIRSCRECQGLSQDKLAKMIGGTSDGAYISRIESGKLSVSVDNLYRIAVALDVLVCDLIDFSKDVRLIIRR